MSILTSIEWCHHTWSPWLGCSKVSTGCKNCYITQTTPFRTRNLKHGDPRQRTSEAYWRQPLKWNNMAMCATCGKSVIIGQQHECPTISAVMAFPDEANWILSAPASSPHFADWLDDEVPIAWLADFAKLIHDTSNLDWLLVTKTLENFESRIRDVLDLCNLPDPDAYYLWLRAWLKGVSPSNVWLGVSVENQQYADERIPQLIKIPAKVQFLSVEPLLGPVKLDVCRHPQNHGAWPSEIHWVIAGGRIRPRRAPL